MCPRHANQDQLGIQDSCSRRQHDAFPLHQAPRWDTARTQCKASPTKPPLLQRHRYQRKHCIYPFRARATAYYRIDHVHVVPQRYLGRDQRSWPIELIALPFQIDVFDPLRSDTSRPSRLRSKQWCALKGHVPGRSTLLAPTMGPIFRGEPFPTFPKLENLLCCNKRARIRKASKQSSSSVPSSSP